MVSDVSNIGKPCRQIVGEGGRPIPYSVSPQINSTTEWLSTSVQFPMSHKLRASVYPSLIMPSVPDNELKAHDKRPEMRHKTHAVVSAITDSIW